MPTFRPLYAVAAGALLAAVPLAAQESPALQQELQKLTAGQEALRKEVLALQKQLLEIRALLQARPAQPQAPQPEPPLPAELSVAGAAVKGAAGAPLTIVEFSDFQCPFCGRHFQQTYGQIDKEYIATGKARYVFRHFPLEQIHPQAFKAGEAAACAGAQNKFWEMHDVLFANQKALQPPDLVKHAQLLGLNGMTFDTCLAGQMVPRIRQDMALAAEVGVRATPTFFIGATLPNGNVKVLRRLNGAVAFTAFKTALDQLAAAPTAP